MKKMLVFPYGLEFSPVLRHSDLIASEYDIKALVSPRGWKLCGDEITYRKAGASKSSLLVQPEFTADLLQEIDTILIPPFAGNEKYESKVIAEVIRICHDIQEVICCKLFDAKNHARLEQSCKDAGCTFRDWATPKKQHDFEFMHSGDLDIYKYDTVNSSLLPINTPVIAVAGTGEGVDKFEVSLAVRRMLLSGGYQAAQIGSKNYCELLGFHSFPSFMFDPQIDERLKVTLFNRYVKQIEESEHPDLLIIGIPGACKSFSDEITQGFGLLHFMVFQAIAVDYLIMCSYYANKNLIDFFRLDSEISKHKYSCSVDCYHLSGTQIDPNSTLELRRLITNLIPLEQVDQTILENQGLLEDSDPILVNIYADAGRQALYQDILTKLNPEYVLL